MDLSFLPHIDSIFFLKVRSQGEKVGKRSCSQSLHDIKTTDCNLAPFLLLLILLLICTDSILDSLIEVHEQNTPLLSTYNCLLFR